MPSFVSAYGLGHGIGLEVHEMPRMGPKFEEPLPAIRLLQLSLVFTCPENLE